ncbi:MAG: glycosyltransferase family 4 protein [Chloroflexi bacterium]|nr:glycosyltransferase family 4 protein [Chloroflexota bacterium]
MHIFIQRRYSPKVGASGLTAQLLSTVEALKPLGITADVEAFDGRDLSPYALAHIYCLPDTGAALRGLWHARRARKAVVVTPIYWNLDRFEREGRALVREWAPEIADPANVDAETRALVEESNALQAQIEKTTLRLVYRSADLLLPQSEMEGAQLVRDFGVSPDAIRVVHNGVDPTYANGSAERFVQKYGVRDFVLCVGRIDPRKNQFSLLRALAQDQLPIVLIGGTTSPEYLAACKKIAGPNTLFLSGFDASQIADAGAAGRVHALVTWGETVGLAALEAGIAGCNLVMTTESSAREYLGEYAWHCDPGDRRAMRDAVLAAYDAPRARARELILQNYTWARAAQESCAAYAELSASRVNAYDPAADIETLVELHARLLPLQNKYIERLWQDKTASAAYAQRLANGRVMRVLRRLEGLRRAF